MTSSQQRSTLPDTDTAPRRRTHTRDPLWSVRETASFLGVPIKTLYEWRYRNEGPPSHRVGRYVRYVPAEVDAWVRDQE